MAITDKKISTIYNGRDISSLSDRPNQDGMTATELKARFDQLGKEIIPKINDLIDELFADLYSGTSQIGHTHNIDNLVDGLTYKLFTAVERAKLGAIAEGAEVNQNAFSNVKVGSTTIASSVKTDTFELVAGLNITMTVDSLTKKITLSATGDLATEAVQSYIEDIGNYFTSLNVEGALQEIGANITEVNAQLADIAKSINAFPIQIPETDDSGRFQRAINSGHSIILEKNAVYTVNNIHISGKNTTIYGNRAQLKTSGLTDSCIIIDATAENISIFDIDFNGLADGSNPNPAGINIVPNGIDYSRGTSAKNIEIAGCNFLGGFVHGIIATGVTGLKIHDNTGTGNKYVTSVGAGGYFILTQTCYDVEIYRNKAVATPTDRHAIYVSCDGTKTGEQRNENVNVYGNTIDWSLTGNAGGFEAAVAIRSTKNLHVYNNKIKGGYAGIVINPSHGDMENVDIYGNQITEVLGNGVNDFYGISAILQDNGGSFKIRNLKYHDNHVSSNMSRVSGYSIYDVIGFEMCNNSGIVSGAGSRGAQIAECSDGVVQGNRFESGAVQARAGIAYGTMSNVTIYGNRFKGFVLGKDEIYPSAVISNLKHPEKRSALILSNGTTITISKQNEDDFIESVTGHVNGCLITFKKNVAVRGGMVSVMSRDGSPVRYFYNRSADIAARTLLLGIKSFDGVTDLNLASITCNFEIIIHE